jgi:hypothetical protein
VSEQNGNGPMLAVDPEAITDNLLRAIDICAQQGALSTNDEDRKDIAQAALLFAQTLVMLDPSRGPNGVPLEHDKQMEELKSRAGAEATSPAKRLKVKRDGQGRATEYEVNS